MKFTFIESLLIFLAVLFFGGFIIAPLLFLPYRLEKYLELKIEHQKQLNERERVSK